MTYFADTWYWAALINRKDQYHDQALKLRVKARGIPIVTSQLVLMELLGLCTKWGTDVRKAAVYFVKNLNTMPNLTVVAYSDQQYTEAVQLYEQVSNDKEWSLVDCASILIMEQRRIAIAISGDAHFDQRPGISRLSLP